MTYKTGEKPGKGKYSCTECNQKVMLDDNSDSLPPCATCSNSEFEKQ